MSEAVQAPQSGAIDLDYVRKLMAHFEPEDWEEGQEMILGALQEINEHFGYVSVEAAEIVAERLGTTTSRIWALLTFYADFRTQPRGKHFMLMCHGMSCYVGGSQKLVQELADKHGISDGGTTAGGELTVQVVNGCLGVCNHAPVVKVDDTYYGHLTDESFNALVQRLIAETPKEK